MKYKIEFTKHALKRCREREIEEDLVIKCIESPHTYYEKNDTALYILKLNSKLLVVAASKREATKIKVITAWITSKVSKYLGK